MATELSLQEKVDTLQKHCVEADLNELNRIVGHLPGNPEPFDSTSDAYSFIGMYMMLILSDKEIEDVYNFTMNKE